MKTRNYHEIIRFHETWQANLLLIRNFRILFIYLLICWFLLFVIGLTAFLIYPNAIICLGFLLLLGFLAVGVWVIINHLHKKRKIQKMDLLRNYRNVLNIVLKNIADQKILKIFIDYTNFIGIDKNMPKKTMIKRYRLFTDSELSSNEMTWSNETLENLTNQHIMVEIQIEKIQRKSL